MVLHRKPANIELSVILCDSTMAPYIIKISTPIPPPPPPSLLPTKETDKRTAATYTVKALIITPPLTKLPLVS